MLGYYAMLCFIILARGAEQARQHGPQRRHGARLRGPQDREDKGLCTLMMLILLLVMLPLLVSS